MLGPSGEDTLIAMTVQPKISATRTCMCLGLGASLTEEDVRFCTMNFRTTDPEHRRRAFDSKRSGT
jgi:hypothetical protein